MIDDIGPHVFARNFADDSDKRCVICFRPKDDPAHIPHWKLLEINRRPSLTQPTGFGFNGKEVRDIVPASRDAIPFFEALMELIEARRELYHETVMVPVGIEPWSPDDFTANAQERYNRALDRFALELTRATSRP